MFNTTSHIRDVTGVDKLYEFQCLPFGLSSTPYIFTKELKLVMAHLRRQGQRVVIYLDDLLIMHQNYSELRVLAQETIELLASLGFSINFEKSSLTPSHSIEYLGVEYSDLDLVILSDASLAGWGTYCEGVEANGPWTPENQSEHINVLELRAEDNAL